MELRHLRYFITVVSERNFTRAAERLHMAQPPLSRQIQQLEEELGLQLIERSSRPLRLTEAGRLIYEQAVQVLERVDDIKALARRLRHAEHSRFTIGFVASTLYGWLPEMIRHYRSIRPNVEVSLVELTTVEQVAALKEGRIDAGFGRIPLEDAAITRTLLRYESIIAAIPTGHALLERDAPLRLDELTATTLVVYPKTPRPSFADQVLALYRSQGLKPAAVLEVRDVQTALGLVAADVGISLVTASVQHLRRDKVEYRPLDDAQAVSPLFMSHRVNDMSPEIAILLDAIRQVYRVNHVKNELGV
ncbi:LysR family transcriptional regulator [Azospirillum sp. TSO35-2]|uniref:LysR family transcriptional regulator n=1 Tax=Azospirillum sp. TSO35-2 TaxID=716796 RepID=UPI000D6102D8|nr:LysR family transcriptional regulator [Azospirillum sp. TSO35-2]PWC31396.1 LysR family transcriptional regulator [Azospirillum sp. TSO35-2]